MKLTLSSEERGTLRQSLGRIKRVTKAAMDAYKKAELETLTADAQMGDIDGALTAIDSAGDGEDVELIRLHRNAILLGLGLLKGDIEQTQDRERGLGIETEASDERLDELGRLGRKLGDQSELELDSETLNFPPTYGGGPERPASDVMFEIDQVHVSTK